MSKRILFITGTRADYGKIKPLMAKIDKNPKYELHIFVTGMHMLSKYGSTYLELMKDGFSNIYRFINQSKETSMDIVLSNTINGISHYINENKIDLIVVHGDRVEALAGAITGALNNVRVAHIEGGEVSGTIDESIRHAISKFSHIHFVSNEEARKRLVQLGEKESNIYVIGSPDIDAMISDDLPELKVTKAKYNIGFDKYSILIYHPVTTELNKLHKNVKELVDAVLRSNLKYIVIYPNNDSGSEVIFSEFDRLKVNDNFMIFPSIKFEYFLTLLKNCEFIIGNSSAGIREAEIYGVPAIDLGNRQKGRYDKNKISILHANEDTNDIIKAITKSKFLEVQKNNNFGKGRSSELFMSVLDNQDIFDCEIQKVFIDLE